MIVGPGAVGSMLAANLYLGLSDGSYPFKIRLAGSKGLSRSSRLHLEKIKSDGLHLKSNFKKYPLAKPNIEFVPSLEKADLVIFAVKIFDLVKASKMFLSTVSSSSIILVVSNGLDAFGKIDGSISKRKVFRGLIETGCELNEIGEIFQHGKARIELSANDSHLISDHKNAFGRVKFLFQDAGFAVSTSEDSRLSEWKKFIANCSINPLATFFECRNGDILREPVLDILCKLCVEIQQLVDSEKLPIDVKAKVLEIVQNTSTNRNSMLKSFLSGSKSELQEITGEILHLAEKRKLYLPLNKFLFSALKIIEDKNKM